MTRRVVLVRRDRGVPIVTWGAIRPKIVLPADADTWSRARLDVVLAHEIAHITRNDWVVQIVAEVCKAIYWFNPFFRMRTQIHANSGASAITKIGCTDWNHDDGNDKPNASSRV